MRLCKHCDSEVKEVQFGDDGLSICTGCNATESETYEAELLDDDMSETTRVCADCNTEVVEKHLGDEGWTYCPGCENVEGPTKEVDISECEA